MLNLTFKKTIFILFFSALLENLFITLILSCKARRVFTIYSWPRFNSKFKTFDGPSEVIPRAESGPETRSLEPLSYSLSFCSCNILWLWSIKNKTNVLNCAQDIKLTFNWPHGLMFPYAGSLWTKDDLTCGTVNCSGCTITYGVKNANWWIDLILIFIQYTQTETLFG